MRSRRRISTILLTVFSAVVLFSTASGQSNDANFPTPLTSSVASGTIKARDIGDSRLTTFYYAFNGGQGDIFINVTTKNFNGDVDVFAVEAMRPLTKMIIFADTLTNETGRLIYLRKPERLLLRIQGRSPNDDPSTFQVKFGGSFVAMEGNGVGVTEAPTVDSDPTGSVRVNSVGTILETPKAERAVEMPVATSKEPDLSEIKTETVAKKPVNKKPVKVAVLVKDPVKQEPAKEPKANREKITTTKKPASKKEEPQPDPLADVRLVIAFKNGDKIEKPLPEILKFSVDKGVLTVIAKDGAIRRYSMVDVAKVTIE